MTNTTAGCHHFEGRSFPGWHHHVSVVMCCYAFVVTERMRRFPPRQVGRRNRTNPFREDVRRRAVDYFFLRRKQKISPAKIALEIGIGLATLQSWTSPKKRLAVGMVPAGFERVEIAETRAQSTKTQLVVRGPGGL